MYQLYPTCSSTTWLCADRLTWYPQKNTEVCGLNLHCILILSRCSHFQYWLNPNLLVIQLVLPLKTSNTCVYPISWQISHILWVKSASDLHVSTLKSTLLGQILDLAFVLLKSDFATLRQSNMACCEIHHFC